MSDSGIGLLMGEEAAAGSTRIRGEIESPRLMTLRELKDKDREVFGEERRSNHEQFLFQRIVWRNQVNACGGPPSAPVRAAGGIQ